MRKKPIPVNRQITTVKTGIKSIEYKIAKADIFQREYFENSLIEVCSMPNKNKLRLPYLFEMFCYFVWRTSLGLLPCAGLTKPSSSNFSIIRAARG